MLALAHIPAKRLRLLERQPPLRSETPLEQGMPQDEDVDPGIGPSAARIVRQAGQRNPAIPRLNPGHAPRLQFGNDAAGDASIERVDRSTAMIFLLHVLHSFKHRNRRRNGGAGGRSDWQSRRPRRAAPVRAGTKRKTRQSRVAASRGGTKGSDACPASSRAGGARHRARAMSAMPDDRPAD